MQLFKLAGLPLVVALTGCNGYPPPLNPHDLNQSHWQATSPYNKAEFVKFELRHSKGNILMFMGRGGCHKLIGIMQISGNRIALKGPLIDKKIKGCIPGREFMIKRYIAAIKQGLILDNGIFYTSDGSVAFLKQKSVIR
ncbi:MAG: hypothetical protein CENE_00761 [Candidatus Celerinatantimonas neptuna]|nr:MAG: hypothetical protein CENE_00761 [Candidatus Celerinatantimonas neptuna]